jgi:hypothetical protein
MKADVSIMRLFINLTPLIPLSFPRRGGRVFREGAKPPSLTYTPPSLLREGGRGIGYYRLLNDLRHNSREIYSWVFYRLKVKNRQELDIVVKYFYFKPSPGNVIHYLRQDFVSVPLIIADAGNTESSQLP